MFNLKLRSPGINKDLFETEKNDSKAAKKVFKVTKRSIRIITLFFTYINIYFSFFKKKIH